MNREETNAVIGRLLGELHATILQAPEDGWGGYRARLPGGEEFYVCAEGHNYGPSAACRIVLSESWGHVATVAERYGHARGRGTGHLRFQPSGGGSLDRPTFDPSRPLATILKDADRRFFKRLKELWPLAEAYRAQCEADVASYLETAELCRRQKDITHGGYSLEPRRIGHAGAYASFEVSIPKEKLALFYAWCQEHEVAR